MILAYVIFGYDNDSFFLPDDGTYLKCSTCGCKNDERYFNENFKLKKKKYDYSSTYDGSVIVSNKLKTIIENLKIADIEFVDLPLAPGFYLFRVNKKIKFDIERSETQFDEFCDNCKRYKSITGATPALLTNMNTPILNGIYRTDVLFGYCNEKSPLIIFGTETFRSIKEKKISGMDFDPIQIQ